MVTGGPDRWRMDAQVAPPSLPSSYPACHILVVWTRHEHVHEWECTTNRKSRWGEAPEGRGAETNLVLPSLTCRTGSPALLHVQPYSNWCHFVQSSSAFRRQRSTFLFCFHPVVAYCSKNADVCGSADARESERAATRHSWRQQQWNQSQDVLLFTGSLEL